MRPPRENRLLPSIRVHAPLANGRPWLFLMASAVCEVVWIVSLKLTDGFARVGPLVVYAVSGLGCAVCLSVALRAIPMGTAYAVWMGASVVGALLVDVAFFKEPWNVFRAACALLILLGTCGLRFAATR
jgi:quaternary ammonium compound-resistance protein SugE